MSGTIIATTRSGSIYVLTLEPDGTRWLRIPERGRLATASSGWLPGQPRVVPGARLLLGALRSTPVEEVAYLPDSSGAIVNGAVVNRESEPSTAALLD